MQNLRRERRVGPKVCPDPHPSSQSGDGLRMLLLADVLRFLGSGPCFTFSKTELVFTSSPKYVMLQKNICWSFRPEMFERVNFYQKKIKTQPKTQNRKLLSACQETLLLCGSVTLRSLLLSVAVCV